MTIKESTKPRSAWSQEQENNWQTLTYLLNQIIVCETAGTQASSEVWYEADRLACALGLDSTLQLEVLRGHSGTSPNGEHSPFLGTRCQYCQSNDLDLELYTENPMQCPPVWLCGASHPEPNNYTHCFLTSTHQGPHQGRLLLADTESDGTTCTWTEQSYRDQVFSVMIKCHDLAANYQEVTPELLTKLKNIYQEANLEPPDDLTVWVATWQKPPRSIIRTGIVLVETEQGLTPTLVDGPDLTTVLKTLTNNAAADQKINKGQAFTLTAEKLGVHEYEIHLVCSYTKEGLSPVFLGEVPDVYDKWQELYDPLNGL